MLNENFNNLNWKDRLEDSNNLSAETLSDKNAAWEKLHNRLRENSNSKKAVWYRAAAACLLLAILIPLMLVHNFKNNVVKNNIEKGIIQEPELKKAELLTKGAIAAAPAVLVEKKRKVKSKIKNYNFSTIAVTNKQPSEINNHFQIEANKIVLPLPKIDSTVATHFEIAQARKKLKVVHLNEIGDPVEAPSDIAHHTDLHLFQLQLATRQIYSNHSVASNAAGIPVLKIKTSQN